MIDGYRDPRTRYVAGFAHIGANDMTRRLPTRIHSIVALSASGKYSSMIKRRADKARRVMTNIALSRCWNMIGRFAARRYPIVTA